MDKETCKSLLTKRWRWKQWQPLSPRWQILVQPVTMTHWKVMGFCWDVTSISDILCGVYRKAMGDSTWWPYDNLRHEDLLKFLLFFEVFPKSEKFMVKDDQSFWGYCCEHTTMYVPAMAEVSPDLEVIPLYFYFSWIFQAVSLCWFRMFLKEVPMFWVGET